MTQTPFTFLSENGKKRRWLALVAACCAAVLPAAASEGEAQQEEPVQVPGVTLEEVLEGCVTAGFVPEYDRHLDRVLLSVHSVAEKAWMDTNLRAMSLLPVYSSVLMVVPEWSNADEMKHFRAVAEARGGESRIVTSKRPEAWAQDIGEGAGEGFMLGSKGREIGPSVARLGIRAFQHFLPLDGGNIHLARNAEGRRFVMVGSEELDFALSMMAEQNVSGDLRSVTLEAYRRTFDADETLVIPNLPSAHIDQMVLCLGDGVVATEVLPEPTPAERRLLVNFLVEWANTPSDGPKEKVALYPPEYQGDSRRVNYNWRSGASAEVQIEAYMTVEQLAVFLRYRAVCPNLNDLVYSDRYRRNRLAIERQLTEKGFKIVHLKTSVWHEHNCQTFVNAMPFRNRQTGRPGVLLPVYRNPGASEEPIDLDNLRGLNRENVETLRALGYEVIPVPSHVQLGGNLHCSIYQF